ncbi:MAG: hypothetical protein H6715_03860 [Myxococcales bacterium]|nr:hypothetical protein [Myxococcales bacterium]
MPCQAESLPEWRQILALNRYRGKLTVVAVDPEDPQRIFVGTELGTILITDDGGITWTERDISPEYNTPRKRIGLDPIYTPPTSHGFNLAHYSINVGSRPPMMTYAVDPEIVPMMPYDVGTSLWAGSNIRPTTLDRDVPPQLPLRTIRGDAIHRNLPASQPINAMHGLSLITDEFGQPIPPQMPIRGIAVCPGATFELLVALDKSLFGSFDGGETFVRLFGLPVQYRFTWAACSPTNPKAMAVTSDWGLFRSKDGGENWDEDALFFPAREVMSITYGTGADGREMMYVTADDRVYSGPVEEWERLDWKYPTYYKSYFTPWARVYWAVMLDNGHIWAATSEGLRSSKDGGDSWDIGGNAMYEREPIKQLVPGTDANGNDMVAIVMDKRVYAADLDGKGMLPFHEGFALRNIEKVATVPGKRGQPGLWWVLTGSELWTSQRPRQRGHHAHTVDEMVHWAALRRRLSPSLEEVVDAVYERLALSPERTTQLERRSWLAYRLPQVHLYGEFQNIDHVSREQTTVTAPALTDYHTDRFVGYGLIQLHWNLDQLWFSRGTAYYIERFRALDRLRQQLRETLEDSWYEREQQLKLMAQGRYDPLQGEVMRTRIECIEAMFQTWMQGKYWDLGQTPKRGRNN